jgi:hypothetical protein
MPIQRHHGLKIYMHIPAAPQGHHFSRPTLIPRMQRDISREKQLA